MVVHRLGGSLTVHPALLTMPDWGGTLAAARCLGERGVPLTVVGENLLDPARWSRYTTRWERAPSMLDAEKFIEWLLAFGKRKPGHVLYPTSDDLAWMIATHRDELGKCFRLFSPTASSILKLLDKKRLYELCLELGIDVQPTAFPKTEIEALEASERIGFPLLFKPRTQIMLHSRAKGLVVESRSEVAPGWCKFSRMLRYGSALRSALPDVDAPMLQAFHAEAAEKIYSLAGFSHESGARIEARASVKALQRPRKIGVGLCFKEASVDATALQAVAKLCARTRYSGVFEVEFIPEGDQLRLIDFNPRFYGQMGFEHGRALPQAWLAYLGATGEHERIKNELDHARHWKEGRGYIYCSRFFLKLMLRLQRTAGVMSGREARHWRSWLETHRDAGLAIDAVDDPRDRGPSRAAALHELFHAARFPRSFLRKIVFDQG